MSEREREKKVWNCVAATSVCDNFFDWTNTAINKGPVSRTNHNHVQVWNVCTKEREKKNRRSKSIRNEIKCSCIICSRVIEQLSSSALVDRNKRSERINSFTAANRFVDNYVFVILFAQRNLFFVGKFVGKAWIGRTENEKIAHKWKKNFWRTTKGVIITRRARSCLKSCPTFSIYTNSMGSMRHFSNFRVRISTIAQL